MGEVVYTVFTLSVRPGVGEVAYTVFTSVVSLSVRPFVRVSVRDAGFFLIS